MSLRYCYSLQGIIYRWDWARYVNQCGWDGVIPKICCPSDQNQVNNNNNNNNNNFNNQNNNNNYNNQVNNYNNQAPSIANSPVIFPSSNEQNQQKTVVATTQPTVLRPVQVKSSIPKIGECGIGPTDRIVGGTATTLDEFPWLALLKYAKGEVFLK